jgi:tetratricopeptide (TPR) repeat protein
VEVGSRIGIVLLSGSILAIGAAQVGQSQQTPVQPGTAAQSAPPRDQTDEGSRQAQQELLSGIALTRSGQFSQAIPHFLAARGQVVDSFALEFNLSLCYVGTRQFQQAIGTLIHIHTTGPHAADVKNLLAQAYVGDHQPALALKALDDAGKLSPGDEKLYLLVSEACLDEGLPELGAQVLAIGLRNLPNSPRLLFERGLIRSRLEQTDLAEQDFQLVRKLAPDSDISYIADAQQSLLSGDIPEAIRACRQGIAAGHSHYLLLTMLGEGLLRSGATPATAQDFAEGQAALERAVELRPNYSSARIALARFYLLSGKVDDAILHLEAARQRDPRNRAIYPALADAYRRAGRPDQAKQTLSALSELNQLEIERIRLAGDGHAGYIK